MSPMASMDSSARSRPSCFWPWSPSARSAFPCCTARRFVGIGLLTSFVTPLLINAGEAKPWPLFGFLTVVWISSTMASKIRNWRVAPALANFGLSIWIFLYIVSAHPYETLPALLPMLI